MITKDIYNIIDDFQIFNNWEDRYIYIIELGKTIPYMHPKYKTQNNMIDNCVSRTWLTYNKKGNIFTFVVVLARFSWNTHFVWFGVSRL